ncbi:virulence factor TspB C-terminal domain-related protein [Neisseria sp.]
MKNNAPRNFIFNCHRPLSVLLLGVVVPHAQVNADVPPPPPVQHQNAGFPSAQKLEQMGYNRETGVWKVQTNPTGKPTVSSGGGQITGTQGQRVTVTDGYGNKATVNTQVTQHVGVGKLQTAANAVIVGQAVGSSYSQNVERYGPKISEDLNKGNYSSAIHNGVLLALETVDGSLGGVLTATSKLGQYLGINNWGTPQQYRDAGERFYQGMRQREAAGDFSGAVAKAAAAKAAAEAAQKTQQKKEEQKKEEQKKDEEAKKNGMIKYQLIVKVDGSYQNYVFYSKFGINLNGSKDNTLNNSPAYLGRFVSKVNIDIPNSSPSRISVSVPSDRHVYVYYNSYKEGTVPESEKQKIAQNESQVKPEDFMLTQKEMLDILKRMLENNQTNHAELMNQLAKMGNVVPDSTTSTEFTPATATTAPYTPSGSNTPQQTQITINRDGSVTTSVIPRPDLVANSPQAPTRSPLIPNNPSTPTIPTSPTSPTSPTTPTKPTSPNNPSTPITPDNPTVPNKPKEDQPPQENTAYEDPDIPTQTVDLDFKPADIFSVDGVCPEPRSVDFGMFGQHEFSYDPLCDFARKIRPILILITIVSCSFFVYSSLKD